MRISRKFHRRQQEEPRPMRIEGIPIAPLTAGPDESELAAQALLETLSQDTTEEQTAEKGGKPEKGTVEYYETLSGKIRLSHDAARYRAIRFVSYCEQQLLVMENERRMVSSGKGYAGRLAALENGLQSHADAVERELGGLKSRWQHCLAEVTVRIMEEASKEEPEEG